MNHACTFCEDCGNRDAHGNFTFLAPSVPTMTFQTPLAHRQGEVLEEVERELQRQVVKWDIQGHTLPEWIAIETEELGEASQAANKAHWTRRNDYGLTDDLNLLMVARAAVSLLSLSLEKKGKKGARGEATRLQAQGVLPVIAEYLPSSHVVDQADAHAEAFEGEMIQVAAVAVAAVESSRRQRGIYEGV